MEMNIHISKTREEFIDYAVKKILEIVNGSIKQRGVCYLALAGGNTPESVYARLSSVSNKRKPVWNNVHFFWGDDRCVPPDHPESNFGMAQRSLLSHLNVPDKNVHRIRGELNPEKSAELYRIEMHTIFNEGMPRFDLILLGMGVDGHTASLFPGTNAVNESYLSVVSVFVPSVSTWRVTFTFPVLNNARDVLILVLGREKAQIVQNVLQASHPTNELPATMVQPKKGRLYWILDADAASFIQT